MQTTVRQLPRIGHCLKNGYNYFHREPYLLLLVLRGYQKQEQRQVKFMAESIAAHCKTTAKLGALSEK